MKNAAGTARLIATTDNGLRVTAAAGRISTTEGTALEIFGKAEGGEKDLRLVQKVLSSGHKSLLEHHSFSIAFENASVLVEQFLIEFRLASFTVKSRRYVNFENAGFYVPPSLPSALCDEYETSMRQRFTDYGLLIGLDIPKEDARFVLPYCFHSNFYVSCNARELVNIVCSMAYGRGASFPEIRALGLQLFEQFDSIYPGAVESERARFERCAVAPLSDAFEAPHVVTPCANLIDSPHDASSMLKTALDFTGRFPGQSMDQAVRQLLRDARPRELECLSYTYLVKDVSLASATHYARHRIQSPMFEHTLRALNKGGYILPASIALNPEALAIYKRSFEENHRALMQAMANGLTLPDASYYALAGGAIDILIAINARELLHFLKLRTCERAQWEIRELSLSLLDQLRSTAPAIFGRFGPSCRVDARCPEGRLSCGKPQFQED